MSETWWAIYVDGKVFGVLREHDDAEGVVEFEGVCERATIVEAEIRPLHQDQCQWELQPAPSAVYQGGDAVPDGTNLDRLRGGGCKYCPTCGRRVGKEKR